MLTPARSTGEHGQAHASAQYTQGTRLRRACKARGVVMGEQSLPFVTSPHTRSDPSEIQNVPDFSGLGVRSPLGGI